MNRCLTCGAINGNHVAAMHGGWLTHDPANISEFVRKEEEDHDNEKPNRFSAQPVEEGETPKAPDASSVLWRGGLGRD